MGLSLYEIDERLRVIEDYQVNPETGELLSDEEFNKLLDEVQMDLQSKIINTIAFAKSLRAEAEAYKTEEENLKTRRKSKENLADRLQKRIDDYIRWQYTNEDGTVNLEGLNKFKLDDAKAYISYRKSEKVEVDDVEKLPKKFVTLKVEKKPDLKAIKEAIKNGENVKSAHITTNMNMQIK